MPRILHGTKTTTTTTRTTTTTATTPATAAAFNMVRPLGQTGPYMPAFRFPNNHPAAYNSAFAQRFLRNTTNPGTMRGNSGPVSHV